jgi:hypothetical protein
MDTPPPPPEVASQLIYALLLCYVERPLTTAMLIVLPRVLQRRWSRASRHVVEIVVYPRKDVPTVCPALLTIPVVVLYIPFHVCCLPEPRLDSPAETALRLIHRQHATFVRRL